MKAEVGVWLLSSPILRLIVHLLLLSSLILHPSPFLAAAGAARESASQLVARALEVQPHLTFSGVVRQDFAVTERPFSA